VVVAPLRITETSCQQQHEQSNGSAYSEE